MPPKNQPERFDQSYYEQFYKKNPVHTPQNVAQLAQGVDAFCRWWNVPPKSVLDIGAGPGFWRDWYRTHHPKTKIVSTDISEHACKTFGHQQRDISKWKPARPFDLVVCHGVLHYLSDRAAGAAIRQLAQATRRVLYLEIPTERDFRQTLDRQATDLHFFIRPGDWYLRRLDRYFVQIGAGLWARRGGGVVLYELEKASRSVDKVLASRSN
jgi:trans-aconitate methyltransferase